MPILTKDFLDSEFPEPNGKFPNPEPAPVEPEADMSRDVVGPIGSAINSEEETIIFYKDLLDMFPDFAPVLEDIIAEEEKHIGQLEVLRNSSSSEMTKNIEKGVEEAEHQLETGSSEEPDDLGEAEVEVDDIAIEIPEEDTIETASKGEIPTEGEFKEYSDKADIEAAKAEIDSEDEKSRYIDDILNEDVSKKKWIYQGPIYNDNGMVVRDGYEWVHAEDKQTAVKELIKRLKKAYKSSHIHIEPQFVKAEDEELSEGIYSYQTFVTRKPGEKSPTKSLIYRDELVIEHSPYGIDKLGSTWKNHIDKLISWCYENYPGLPRVTADYRLEKFGKEAESKEAYISAIESELKRGRMSIQESLITESYNPEVKPGDKIRIIDMAGESHYAGRTGEVEYIDDMGQIHGTWGGCALIPEEDTYELIIDENLTEEIELEEAYKFPKLGSLPNAREQILEIIQQDNWSMAEFIIDGHIEVPYYIKAKHLTSGQQRVGTLTDFEVETDGIITIYFDRYGHQNYEDLEYIISDVPRSTITYTMLKAIQNAATKLNKQIGTAVARDNNVYALLQQNPEIAEEFKQTIKKITYEIPLLDQYSPIGELDKDGELLSEEAVEKLEKIYDNFINLPFANDAIDAGMVKHRDFTTDTSRNIATSWGGIGLITFNCTIDQLSEHAQALILTAKVKKEDSDGHVVDKATMVSCYRLANALIKYFDNDISFYQKKSVLVASLKNK